MREFLKGILSISLLIVFVTTIVYFCFIAADAEYEVQQEREKAYFEYINKNSQQQ